MKRLIVEVTDIHLKAVRRWEIDAEQLPEEQLVVQAHVEEISRRRLMPPVPLDPL